MPDVFNYREDDERAESFRAWFLIHLLAEEKSTTLIPDVLLATNDLTDVRVTFQVNGIEIEGDKFIDSFEQVIDWQSDRLASRKVSVVPSFDDLYDLLREVEDTVKAEVKKRVRDAGLDFNDDY